MKKLVLILFLWSATASGSTNGNGIANLLKHIPKELKGVAFVALVIGGSWLSPLSHLEQIANNTEHLEKISADTAIIRSAITQRQVDEILDILDGINVTEEERRLLERKLNSLTAIQPND